MARTANVSRSTADERDKTVLNKMNRLMVIGLLTPPDVGAADASSAIDIPTNRMKMLATSHYPNLSVTVHDSLRCEGNIHPIPSLTGLRQGWNTRGQS